MQELSLLQQRAAAGRLQADCHSNTPPSPLHTLHGCRWTCCVSWHALCKHPSTLCQHSPHIVLTAEAQTLLRERSAGPHGKLSRPTISSRPCTDNPCLHEPPQHLINCGQAPTSAPAACPAGSRASPTTRPSSAPWSAARRRQRRGAEAGASAAHALHPAAGQWQPPWRCS